MNYTLQLHGERLVYPLPSGLTELMSDISREVLRQQPSQLYKYIADYLDTLLRLRVAARHGSQLITSVLGDAQERLQLVVELGLSWEEADQAARKIQQTYRGYRERQRLREKQRVLRSQSFQKYLTSLDIDLETTSKRSSLIEEAYTKFMTKELDQEMKPIYSTHTIEGFSPKPLDKTAKKDSKNQVGEHYSRITLASEWSAMLKGLDKQREKISDKHTKLVYQQTPCPELANPRLASLVSGSDVVIEPGRLSLPSYYDDTQTKVPMIDETGTLAKEESNHDIVTLLSNESIFYIKKRVSFGDMSPIPESKHSQSDMARELMDIIEKRSSRLSKFIKSLDSVDEKQQTDNTTKHDSSANSVSSKKSSTKSKKESVTNKVIDVQKESFDKKGSNSLRKIKSKSDSKSKVDFAIEVVKEI